MTFFVSYGKKFQGSHVKYCICSLTRSNRDGEIGILNKRYVKLVFSIAKLGLILVGNGSMFFKKSSWAEILKAMVRKRLVVDVLEQPIRRFDHIFPTCPYVAYFGKNHILFKYVCTLTLKCALKFPIHI